MTCVFCRIATGELPTELLYEDEDLIAFRDIQPMAPIHILVVPKQHITTFNDLPESDILIIGKMALVAREMARKEGIDKNGFRIVMNTEHEGGQTVWHMHMHILGGRKLSSRLG